eukprot:Phypoly_transcript_11226.p1 GENE.Phypoly_transcript_11226~~Phypoly_transcript_11226.p1  ORF type:complete len:325 (+),score=70.80 Phypoly_transcript_11226:43-975(+)
MDREGSRLRYPLPSSFPLPSSQIHLSSRSPTPTSSPPLTPPLPRSPPLSTSALVTGTHSSLAHTNKLNDVHDRLTEFQNVIQSEVQQRKSREMQRLMQFDATAEQVAKLEKRINFEIKQRQDTNRAVQSIFESQLQQAAEWWEGAMKERTEQLLSAIELLTKRVSLLERDLEEEKKKRTKENTDSYDFIAGQLVSLKQQIDQEKLAKSDDLGTVSSTLRGEISDLGRRIDSEKIARDVALANQRSELKILIETRSSNEERIETRIFSEIEKLKASIIEESETREKQAAQIVNMLDKIVLDLQGGIHLAFQ